MFCNLQRLEISSCTLDMFTTLDSFFPPPGYRMLPIYLGEGGGDKNPRIRTLTLSPLLLAPWVRLEMESCFHTWVNGLEMSSELEFWTRSYRRGNKTSGPAEAFSLTLTNILTFPHQSPHPPDREITPTLFLQMMLVVVLNDWKYFNKSYLVVSSFQQWTEQAQLREYNKKAILCPLLLILKLYKVLRWL